MLKLLFTILIELFPIIIVTLSGYTEGDVGPLNTEQSVSHFGYPFAKYKLRTKDEFTLGLERIPYTRYGDRRTVGRPVLLIHGLFLSSYIFTLSNQSLSFSMSDAGYDVWLFNARGSGLSRTLTMNSNLHSAPQMNTMSWNYSFHEMGIYDLTTVIDFILNITGHAKIDVIGYSMGSTIAIIGLSEKPEYNDKVNRLVLMAPTIKMTSHGFPVTIFERAFPVFKFVTKEHNFFPMFYNPDAVHRLMRLICTLPVFHPLCKIHFTIAQGVLANYNKDTIVNAITDFPQPVSKKVLFHWKQIMASKKFCKYDYGISENIRRYNMTTPPAYNLSRVTVPTFILHSKNDHLSAVKDVNWLVNELPNVKNVYYINTTLFGHLCFVMNTNIEQLVNKDIKNALSSN